MNVDVVTAKYTKAVGLRVGAVSLLSDDVARITPPGASDRQTPEFYHSDTSIWNYGIRQ